MSILKDFISLVEGEGDSVDIRELFEDDEERHRWEKMVEVFEHIQIDRVSEGLKSVGIKYNLTRDEEVNILAYVKFLELMVIKMDMIKKQEEGDTNSGEGFHSFFPSPNETDDSRMYG
tara:strand:- start:76 stop:429 length:354 start_codon:yes stop_codon:yes gene_type:complete